MHVRIAAGRCVRASGWTTEAAAFVAGTGGKRVRSAHNGKAVSDPQVGSETSAGHGSALHDD